MIHRMIRNKPSHRSATLSFLLVAILVAACRLAFPQAQMNDDPQTSAMRKQALQLYREGKFVEAMPLLEKLAGINPSDFVVREHWAYCVLEYSKTLTNPQERRAARRQARQLGLEAKKLGDEGELLQVLLSIPEDGSDLKFSERADVDEAMKGAEASRAKGNLDDAKRGYLHVLELDPKNYDATVYVGDVYFSERAFNSAGEWFDKAIKLDPDKETAYRYWGDALGEMGKNGEAREKYIYAVIAEPYTRPPWTALRRWTDRTNQQFNAILLQNKSSVKNATDKAVKLEEQPLKEVNAEEAGWNAYEKVRQEWKNGKFKQQFPNEPAYRHTLKEEAEALDALVAALAPDAASLKKAEKLDPALLALIQIDHEGLLEPYVLLNRADPEIAKDYPAYRAAHRDKLYQYMDKYVLTKTNP
jgi:tetratricopeptide (TPR) repeat protein